MKRQARLRPIETHADISKAPVDGGLPWQVEMLPVGHIKQAERNARTHPRKQIKLLARSIERFGAINPVVIDGHSRLVAGHARLDAAKLLGLTRIPAIRLWHLSPAELRAYALADNKLAEKAGWNRRLLVLEIEQLSLELPQIGFDIGFEPFEIDALFADQAEETPDPADEVIEARKGPAVARVGDCFLLAEHRLLVGDARKKKNFTRLLAGSKARMGILDPPYNVRVRGHVGGRGRTKHREFMCASGEMSPAEYTDFLKQTLSLCSAHSIDGSIHFVFIDWRHVGELTAAGKAAYDELKNICVWTKTTPGQGTFYRSQHELVFVFKHGQAPHLNNFELGQHGRTRSNVWHYPGVNTFRAGRMNELRMHPTVKPVALVADAMRDCSRRGDIVLDVFAGSGTTIMAADKIGRRAFCMEIDPTYVDVAIERWQRFTKRDAVLEATGETFDDLTTRRGVSS
jgi:DNA methylase/ParB-like nuclease domain